MAPSEVLNTNAPVAFFEWEIAFRILAGELSVHCILLQRKHPLSPRQIDNDLPYSIRATCRGNGRAKTARNAELCFALLVESIRCFCVRPVCEGAVCLLGQGNSPVMIYLRTDSVSSSHR